jgi:hypothetical protein
MKDYLSKYVSLIQGVTQCGDSTKVTDDLKKIISQVYSDGFVDGVGGDLE